MRFIAVLTILLLLVFPVAAQTPTPDIPASVTALVEDATQTADAASAVTQAPDPFAATATQQVLDATSTQYDPPTQISTVDTSDDPFILTATKRVLNATQTASARATATREALVRPSSQEPTAPTGLETLDASTLLGIGGVVALLLVILTVGAMNNREN